MNSIPLYLVWSSDGELYLLESSGNGLNLCSNAKFSDYETHCVSSVLDRNGKLRIFAGRINLIESFMVDINGDDILINKNSYSKISSTNTLGFMRIDAKLISGTGKSKILGTYFFTPVEKLSNISERNPRSFRAG